MKIFGFNGQLNNDNLIPLGSFADFVAEYTGEAFSTAGIGKCRFDFSDSAVCLGDFDGVHIGHRRLFDIAKKYPKWGVLIFDRNTKGSMLLTTLSEKLEIINGLGADYAVIAEFSEDFSHSTPEQFVYFLRSKLKMSSVVAGYDYRFGYKAEGDAELLKKLCDKAGISAEISEAVTDGGEPVKSTKIRTLIRDGNLKKAAELLGGNYIVSAIVQKGLQNGRKLGFPTANIEITPDKILPPDGVYYGKVCGRDAVINIGKNPTFGAQKRTIEAHILDFGGDMYGARVTAELIEKIRSDIKFDSPDGLIKQISNDINWVKERKG